MNDYYKFKQKSQTSNEAFNIITLYFFSAYILGSILLLDKISRMGGIGLVADKYYWWVFGAFVVCSLGAILGRYCADRSIDS